MGKVELKSDQIQAVDTFMKVISLGAYGKYFFLNCLVNFRPQYVEEVIPEGTVAKKYERHKHYQLLTSRYEGLKEAFLTFDKYNTGHREAMLLALVTGEYESKILFKRKQVVIVDVGRQYVGILKDNVIEGETEYAELYSDSWFDNLIGKFPVRNMRGIK